MLSREMDGGEAEVKRVHNNDAFLVEPTISPTLQTMRCRNAAIHILKFEIVKLYLLLILNCSSKQFDYKHLRIPRKPGWKISMTATEIDRREKDAFLEWRR